MMRTAFTVNKSVLVTLYTLQSFINPMGRCFITLLTQTHHENTSDNLNLGTSYDSPSFTVLRACLSVCEIIANWKLILQKRKLLLIDAADCKFQNSEKQKITLNFLN